MSRHEDYEFLLRLALKHEPLYVPSFGAEYCIRSDGSNTVSDGTGDARAAAIKRRLWNIAQGVLEEKKMENVGWWVREVHTLPPLYSAANTAHYLAATSYRDQLKSYYNSTSWRLTRSARNAARRLKGMAPFHEEVPSTEEQALAQIHAVLSSRSWEITAPLRILKRTLSVRRKDIRAA
jgi:hypothetical protein